MVCFVIIHQAASSFGGGSDVMMRRRSGPATSLLGPLLCLVYVAVHSGPDPPSCNSTPEHLWPTPSEAPHLSVHSVKHNRTNRSADTHSEFRACQQHRIPHSIR